MTEKASGITSPAHYTNHQDPSLEPGNSRAMVIKSLCQGFFCHHREMNSTSLRHLNRCYSVCVDCGMKHRITYQAPTPEQDSELAIHQPDPDEPGFLDRHHVVLSKGEYEARRLAIDS